MLTYLFRAALALAFAAFAVWGAAPATIAAHNAAFGHAHATHWRAETRAHGDYCDSPIQACDSADECAEQVAGC